MPDDMLPPQTDSGTFLERLLDLIMSHQARIQALEDRCQAIEQALAPLGVSAEILAAGAQAVHDQRELRYLTEAGAEPMRAFLFQNLKKGPPGPRSE